MQHKTDSIDKILLEKGLITPEQLTSALHYQCRLPAGQEMTLSQVLVAMEFVTEAQLQRALGVQLPEEDLLLQMLIKDGMIQEEQLQSALQLREEQHLDKRVGTVLLELGHTTKEMIESALKHYYQQHHQVAEMPTYPSPPAQAQPSEPEEPLPLGQKLIRKGYISPAELKDAIDYQQRLPRMLHKPVGEILVDLGYLTPEMLQEVIDEQSPRRQLSLGEILVKAGLIQQWQLSHAMSLVDLPEHAGKKLGHLIVELGYARRPEIEAALKDYYARQKSRP